MGAATTGFNPQGGFPGQPPLSPVGGLTVSKVEIEPEEEGSMFQARGQVPKKKRVRRIPPQKPPQKPNSPTQSAGKPDIINTMKRNPLKEMMGESSGTARKPRPKEY